MTGLQPVAQTDFPLNKLIFPSLFCLMAALFLAERPGWSRDTHFVSVALVLFLGYCAASALWAIVPSRSVSQLLLLGMSLAIIAMACQVSGSLEAIFRAMFLVFAATLAVNLADVVLTPPGAIGHQGIYPHKNGLGAVAALGLLIAFYGIGRRERLLRLIGLVMIPVALIILWKSESKTSLGLAVLVPMLAAGFWVLMRYLRIALPVGFVLAGLAAAIVIPLLASQGFTIGDISMLIGDDATFTGRTAIWSFASEEIAKRPLLGHGFRSFWGIGDLSPALHAPPGFVQVTPHGHNGYIDIVLELGFVGLVLFVLLLLGVVGRVHAMARRAPAVAFAAFCLVCYLALQNLLETNWLEPLDAGTTLLAVLLFAPLSRKSVGQQ